jgi:hypothetical protein
MRLERARKNVDDLVALAWLIGEGARFMESHFQRQARGRDSARVKRFATAVLRHRLLIAAAVATGGAALARARASGRG